MLPRTFHQLTHHLRQLPPRDDQVGLLVQSHERLHLPTTKPLMHENSRSHHDRFPGDLGNPRFHRVVAKDRTDLLDPSQSCEHKTGVLYQREQCPVEIEKLYELQWLTQQHQDLDQGVPRYEKLSQSEIREYRQPARLIPRGSWPEVGLAT